MCHPGATLRRCAPQLVQCLGVMRRVAYNQGLILICNKCNRKAKMFYVKRFQLAACMLKNLNKIIALKKRHTL